MKQEESLGMLQVLTRNLLRDKAFILSYWLIIKCKW
jgi:hypothetical protein